MQTKVIKINPTFPEPELISEGAMSLKNGGLVAFPTETVYGIGANFLDPKAIDRLYEIKKRPKSKPFTIHIANFEALKGLEMDLAERPYKIIHKFWPGPLTILAFNKKGEKLGVRMPKNNIALALIEEVSIPIVAPSANISGKSPPTSSEDIMREMNGLIDLILDGGKTEIGMESTILDITTQPFTILREGAISEKDLLSDYHILFVCTGNSCRSVMAKAILEKLVKDAGLSNKVYVDSAGISTYSGIQAAPNTVQVLKEIGIDISMHSGKNVTLDLLKKSDFIFVMEKQHKDIILNMMRDIGSKARLLREFGDIPDPIGKPIEEYKKVLSIIKEQVEDIFLEIFKTEGNK